MFNESKTQQQHFYLRPLHQNYMIDTVCTFDMVKFLSIISDHNLTWGQHNIDFVIPNLARRIVYFFRRLKNCVGIKYVRTAYFAHFQTIVKYGLLLWFKQ